jgi:astacin
MDAIAARAGVLFRPAVASDPNRIRFQNSTGNNSPVGVQGGAQIINIFNWGTQIIICHEIYHSLGFWHEQSRSDRGTYVTINANNICGTASSGACAPATCQLCQDSAGNWISCAFNFAIQPGSSTYGPYDFDSFMHYGSAAFSCNGLDTITVNAPWNAEWQNAIGQRDHFSYFDRITCRAL